MHKVDQLLSLPIFSLKREEKNKLLLPALLESVEFHRQRSPAYRRWVEHTTREPFCLEDLAYIPGNAFKQIDLCTVSDTEIVDIRNSSSTTSGTPSVVKRDQLTLDRYKRSRNAVLNDYCGKGAVGFQIGIIEDPRTHPNPRLSANLVVQVITERTALGATAFVVEDSDGEVRLDFDGFLRLAKKHQEHLTLIFCHTAYLYLLLIAELKRNNLRLHLSETTLIHGWGWKKFSAQAVSNNVLRREIEEYLGILSPNILDMYGFAESNSLYLECSAGWRHVPEWDEVLVRDPLTLAVVADGEPGLMQFLSAIPHSYAGNSVLTDDIGVKCPIGNCSCGRRGSAFKILRRADESELTALYQTIEQMKQTYRPVPVRELNKGI